MLAIVLSIIDKYLNYTKCDRLIFPPLIQLFTIFYFESSKIKLVVDKFLEIKELSEVLKIIKIVRSIYI